KQRLFAVVVGNGVLELVNDHVEDRSRLPKAVLGCRRARVHGPYRRAREKECRPHGDLCRARLCRCHAVPPLIHLQSKARSAPRSNAPLPRPFDGHAARPLRSKADETLEFMEIPSSEMHSPDFPARALPRLPQIWIGYLMGIATMVAEIVAVQLHP